MKTLLAVFLLLIVTASLGAAVLAQNQREGNTSSSDPTPAVNQTEETETDDSGSDSGDEPLVISPNPTADQQEQSEGSESGGEGHRARVEKTYEDGTKTISVSEAGPYNHSTTVTIVNDTYKTIVVESTRGSLIIEVDGRGPADITRNGVFMEQVSEEFENYTEIDEIEIDPAQNRIRARVRDREGNESETEIPETLQTRVRARIESEDVNLTMDKEQKQIRLVSAANVTAMTREKIQLENGSVFITTEKVRQRVHILPETASENARLHANFHTVKAVEIVEEDGSIVYSIQGLQRGKILGLIDTQVDSETQVDPETGRVIKSNKPWWSFLVF